MNLWRRFPFHLFFFTSYPIVALVAANSGQVRLAAMWRPLAFSLAVAFILWLAISWLLKDRMKAAVLVSMLTLLFFSYGHVYEWAQRASLLDGGLGRHRYLLPLWVLIFLAGMLLLRRLKRTQELNLWLNSVGLILILMPLLQMGGYQLRTLSAGGENMQLVDPANGETIALVPPEPMPDVYFIVLDAYARSDVLEKSWGIDNSAFLNELEAMGFQVASCSQSNYAQTELAFASTLNMAYLDDLGDEFVSNRDDRAPLRPLIKHSLVRRLLAEQGYQTVAFETGYPFSEIGDADVYIAPRLPGLSGGLSGFEALLLRSSAGLILLDASELLPRFLVPDVDHSVVEHRQRTLLTLATLSETDQFEGPTFIFAHIVSPHTPFIFGPGPDDGPAVSPTFEGSDIDRQTWYRQGYADQIEYLNDRMLGILESILAQSGPNPIIIMQGDHGPEEGSSQDRMRIFNAYYLPDQSGDALYPAITPVNSFRVVFNRFFGGELPLLQDKSYFSTYNRPYDYNLVDNNLCPSVEE